MEKPVIRAATEHDAEAIVRIYNHYILNTIITFEEAAITAEEMAARMREVWSASFPWLIAEQNGVVLGFAYASKWKGRCAYRYSAESTVYLDPAYLGQGFGSQLYAELLDILYTGSIHAVIGGIALPNAASVALHERFGFSKVAHFEEVGFKFDQWIDVGYWQALATGPESA
jgi:phosphinothricin acetyltransferase